MTQQHEGFEALFQTPPPATETEVGQHETAAAALPEEEETRTSSQTKLNRLERLEQKKAQIEHQIKAIHARESEKERKVRTRRLIQIGALSEKYFNCEGIEPGHYEELLKQLVAVESVKGILKQTH